MRNQLKWKQCKKWISGICVVSLLLSPVQVLSSNLNDLEDRKDAIEDELNELEQDKENVFDSVKEFDEQLKVNTQKLTEIEKQLEDKTAELKITEEELVEAKEKIDVQYDAMKSRIKHIYENGDVDYIGLILQSENVGDLINRSEYVKQVADYDKNLITSLKDLKNEIAVKEQRLKVEQQEIEKLKAQAEDEKQHSQDLLASKTDELQKVNLSIDVQEQRLKEYNDAIAAEKEEMERQEREAANASNNGQGVPDFSGNGALLWPVPGHTRITSDFGQREQPTPGASTNHQGIDIGAPAGTNIVAAESGTVVISQYSNSAGNYVMINHGGELFTVYMHASQLLVSVGQTVQKGQTIALVGSTGFSTGPHLHFGVRASGVFVNPVQYL